MPLRYDINESLQRYVMRPFNVTSMCPSAWACLLRRATPVSPHSAIGAAEYAVGCCAALPQLLFSDAAGNEHVRNGCERLNRRIYARATAQPHAAGFAAAVPLVRVRARPIDTHAAWTFCTCMFV